MNQKVTEILDGMEAPSQQDVLDVVNQVLDGTEEEKLDEAAIHIINRDDIKLEKDQKQIFDALEVNLRNVDGDISSEMILSRIDMCCQFLGIGIPSPLTKRIILYKMKLVYRYSREKRTQFKIPAIKDIANVHQLEFTDEDKENWHYWNKHRNFLQEKYVKAGDPRPGLEMINRIDRQSDKILRFFRDPRKPYPEESGNEGKDFSTAGLVIGHVQSGKTANFMSLISKSASIGYRFIIILSGTKNDLRNQTQNRFDQELSGMDRHNLKSRGVKFVDWNSAEGSNDLINWSIDGVKSPPPANAGRFWRYHSLTSTEDLSENLENMTDVFNQYNVVVAVVKKNALRPLDGDKDYNFRGILGRLNRWILTRRDQTYLPPTLIIDDEADQASVDAKATRERLEEEGYEPTTINGCLQTLVRDIYGERLSGKAKARQISFVGYTATPFANVFMSANHDSLYPKDFIISLDPPENYFGMDKYFGENLSDLFIDRCSEEQAEEERKMLKDPLLVAPIPPEETLPQRLITAFHEFLFYSVIKDLRNLKQEKTMMVHSSRLVDEQSMIFERLKGYKEALEGDLESYWGGIIKDWRKYIQDAKEIQKILQRDYLLPEMNEKEIFEKIHHVLANLKFKLINGQNDSLDYSQEQMDYVVAVGGDILSRGLTLEGLAVSYYMRNSYNYDSLLQMARWFGYRDNYEDLIRVYTSQTISDSFEHLLRVEADLREEIKNYERNGVTPEDFAPRVQAHMKMRPSGRMGVAERQTSLSGQLIQTFIMNTTDQVLRANHQVTHDFIDLIHSNYQPVTENGSVKYRGVEPHFVLEHFIENYEFGHTETRGIRREEVREYIQSKVAAGELQKMDIVISGLANRKDGSEPEKVAGHTINPVVRNNLRKKVEARNDLVHFGAISSPSDFRNETGNTKMALYFIDRNNSSSAFGMVPPVNPVAFAISFPQFGDIEYWRQEIFN